MSEGQMFAMLQQGMEGMRKELSGMRGQLTELTTSQVQLNTRFEAMSSLGKRVGDLESKKHEQELKLVELTGQLETGRAGVNRELRLYRWIFGAVGLLVLAYVFKVAMQMPP